MWFDIMKLAAYKQYNKKIPETAECWGTGRLKRNYGVEPIMRMLSGKRTYREVHNAVCDAVDELKIMKLLGYSIDEYAYAPKMSRIQKAHQPRLVQQPKPLVKEELAESFYTEDVCSVENCKYAVGDNIKHKTYGCGIIRKVERINEELLLLTVRYETIGISLHLLPADERDIQLLSK